MQSSFTYRASRSAGFLIGILMAVAVETIAIHLLFHASHPVISWLVVVISILSGVWIAVDYRARGTGVLKLDSSRLELQIGLRPPFDLRVDNIAAISRANWREIPQQNRQYINLTAPAQPNVLLTLREPVRVPIALGVKRQVSHLGLHVDEPDEFVSCEAEHVFGKGKMRQTAQARFAIKNWEEKPYSEGEDQPRLTRASVSKTYTGDIEGAGQIEYVMMYRSDGTAAFVGLERIVGSLAGKSGSFVLQRTGVFEAGLAKESYTIIAGSATGDLIGLVGDGSSAVGHGLEHPFTLGYELP